MFRQHALLCLSRRVTGRHSLVVLCFALGLSVRPETRFILHSPWRDPSLEMKRGVDRDDSLHIFLVDVQYRGIRDSAFQQARV